MSISDNYVPVKELGDGSTNEFTGSWKPLSTDYVKVFWENVTTGVQVEKTEGADYDVTITSSGFTVDFSSYTTPPATEYVVISRETPQDQNTPYRTSKGFQGKVHEDSYDKLTAIAQEQQDDIDRSPKFPLGATITNAALPIPVDGFGLVWDGVTGKLRNTTASLESLEGDAETVADNIASVVIVAADLDGDDDIGTVAASIADVNTVAGSIASVNTVAANDANITTVAANDADITTVADDIANVNTVAGNIANVNIVAGNSANVTIVADDIANVNTAANNIAAIIAAPDEADDAAASAAAALTSENNAAASAAAAASSAAEGLYNNVVTLTNADSPYQPSAAEEGAMFKLDMTSGAIVINLDELSDYGEDMKFAFVKIDGTGNSATINRGGTDTISGGTSVTLATQYETHVLAGDSADGTWIDTVQSTGLADNQVTNAKLADMANSTIKGRTTAGSGDPEDLTAAQVRAILSVYTQAQVDAAIAAALAGVPTKVASFVPAGSSTEIVIPVTFQAGYNYRIEISNLQVASNSTGLQMVMSLDDGANYVTSANAYATRRINGQATTVAGSTSVATQVDLTAYGMFAGNFPLSGTLKLYDPNNSGKKPMGSFHYGMIETSGTMANGVSEFVRNANMACNKIKLVSNTNFSNIGRITVWEEPCT